MRLEKIQREFHWGGGALERKIYLMKWKAICSNKDKGGLSVKCLGTLNKALRAKWAWRFAPNGLGCSQARTVCYG